MLIYWNCSGFSAWMASLWSFTTNLLFLATCSWLGHSRKLQEIPINVLKFMLVVTKYHYEQTHGKLKRETSLLRSTQLIFRNALVQNCVTRALGVFVVVADEILSDMLIFWNCIGFSSWMASLWSFRIGRSRCWVGEPSKSEFRFWIARDILHNHTVVVVVIRVHILHSVLYSFPIVHWLCSSSVPRSVRRCSREWTKSYVVSVSCS